VLCVTRRQTIYILLEEYTYYLSLFAFWIGFAAGLSHDGRRTEARERVNFFLTYYLSLPILLYYFLYTDYLSLYTRRRSALTHSSRSLSPKKTNFGGEPRLSFTSEPCEPPNTLTARRIEARGVTTRGGPVAGALARLALVVGGAESGAGATAAVGEGGWSSRRDRVERSIPKPARAALTFCGGARCAGFVVGAQGAPPHPKASSAGRPTNLLEREEWLGRAWLVRLALVGSGAAGAPAAALQHTTRGSVNIGGDGWGRGGVPLGVPRRLAPGAADFALPLLCAERARAWRGGCLLARSGWRRAQQPP
jgi:hypothetical protein